MRLRFPGEVKKVASQQNKLNTQPFNCHNFSVARKFGDCVVIAILAKQGILNQDQYVTQYEAKRSSLFLSPPSNIIFLSITIEPHRRFHFIFLISSD